MSDQFVGEVRMFAGNFAPTGWAFCNGQSLPVEQNTALFALLQYTYGGSGTDPDDDPNAFFLLPDLRGATPLQAGQGQGLSMRDLGDTGGQGDVTLTTAEMPAHSHTLAVNTSTATTGSPSSSVTLAATSSLVYGPPQNLMRMGDNAGGGQPHNNRQPFLVVTFIIALQGIFPSHG